MAAVLMWLQKGASQGKGEWVTPAEKCAEDTKVLMNIFKN